MSHTVEKLLEKLRALSTALFKTLGIEPKGQLVDFVNAMTQDNRDLSILSQRVDQRGLVRLASRGVPMGFQVSDYGQEAEIYGSFEAVGVHQAEREVQIWSPQDKVQLYDPKGRVHVNDAREQVHVYDPQGRAHVYAPHQQVHIYEPRKELHIYQPEEVIHIYQPKQHIHFHGGKAEVLTSPDDPVPPYSLHYEDRIMLETDPPDRSKDLDEMPPKIEINVPQPQFSSESMMLFLPCRTRIMLI